MPVRRNGAYNDPAMGEAFDNIASIFKPPSGSDLYGYAHAADTRQKMARQAKAFERIQAGEGTAADYAAAGIADPSKQYALADQYRRSQEPGAKVEDLDAGAYVIHGNANNTFEGQGRKLRSDERNKRTEERTKIITTGMAPIAKDAVRVTPPNAMDVLGYDRPATDPWGNARPAAGEDAALAASAPTVNPIASLFGPQPAAAPPAGPLTQYGQTELDQGKVIVRPDGTRLEGPKKPLNESEAKAAELQRLRTSGVIDDQTMKAIVFGNTPLEMVATPGGNRNVLRPDAVGQTPAPDDSKAPKPILQNYQTQDGRKGSARFDTTINDYVDTATGARLPQGTLTFGANLTGGVKDTGLGPTTSNVTDANKREAENGKTRTLLKNYTALIQANPGVIGAVGALRGFAQDMIQSVKEGAQAFSDDPASFEQYVQQVETLAKQKGYDPAIAKAEFLRHVLGYRLAKTQNPSGEVNVRELVLNKDALGGGMLSNQQSAAAKLEEFAGIIDAEDQAIGSLRGAGSAAPAPGAPVKVEKWVRGPNGQLVKGQ